MTKRILVVDDSITDRKRTCDVLDQLGIKYYEAINGEDGVEKAKEILPDLIIMDVVMPKMDGLNALRAIRKEPTTKSIPVIICSTKSQPNDIAWAKAQGAKDYLVKPISGNALAQKIFAIFGK